MQSKSLPDFYMRSLVQHRRGIDQWTDLIDECFFESLPFFWEDFCETLALASRAPRNTPHTKNRKAMGSRIGQGIPCVIMAWIGCVWCGEILFWIVSSSGGHSKRPLPILEVPIRFCRDLFSIASREGPASRNS